MSTIKATNIQPQSDSDPLVFSTNATERMRIPSSGGVSITGGATVYGDIEVFDGAFVRSGGLSVTGSASISQNMTVGSNLTVGSSTLSTPSGSAPMFVCRAFARYTLSGTSTTGVLSAQKTNNLTFTRTSTGVYTGTFATEMSDENYIVIVSAGGIIGTATTSRDIKINTNGSGVVSPTTSSFTFSTMQDGGVGPRDVTNFSVAVFA